MKGDISSLAHNKWECNYHIMFVVKFRRKAIYVGIILRELCRRKGVEIIEVEVCPYRIQ